MLDSSMLVRPSTCRHVWTLLDPALRFFEHIHVYNKADNEAVTKNSI